MIVNKKLINFFLLMIFTFGLFFSSARIITHNNFPVQSESSQNFYQHYLDLKNSQHVQEEMINDDFLCENLISKDLSNTSKGYYRHSLRWVFDKLRINYLETTQKFAGNNFMSFAFSFMIFVLITLTFFFSLLPLNKNIFLFIQNNKVNYLMLLILFFFIISFYSFKNVSELRYSFFEMFFISASIYFALIKKRVLFLITVILATLNRESGILISSIWFIFNGLRLSDRKLSFDLKEIFYGLLFVFICITILISINIQLFSCGIALSNTSLASKSVFSGNIFKSINIIFSNFIIIILLFIFYFKRSYDQIKLILLAFLYLIVFIIFTPADHHILRILFAPILVLYANYYLTIKKI